MSKRYKIVRDDRKWYEDSWFPVIVFFIVALIAPFFAEKTEADKRVLKLFGKIVLWIVLGCILLVVGTALYLRFTH